MLRVEPLLLADISATSPVDENEGIKKRRRKKIKRWKIKSSFCWKIIMRGKLFKKVTNSFNALMPENWSTRFLSADGFKQNALNYITPLISSNDFCYTANTSWWIGVELIQICGGKCVFLSHRSSSLYRKHTRDEKARLVRWGGRRATSEEESD